MMTAGIDAGVAVLTGTGSNALADKVMILMTDGEWNVGRDPILAAQDATGYYATRRRCGFFSCHRPPAGKFVTESIRA